MFKILFLCLAATASGITPPLIQSRQSTSCSTPNGPGFCGNTANGCSGTFYPGYCPGPSNIQCCVKPCSTPNGNGYCQYTSSSCSGKFTPGYCPGASDYQVSPLQKTGTINWPRSAVWEEEGQLRQVFRVLTYREHPPHHSGAVLLPIIK